MIITFKELGIKVSDYMGYTFSKAHSEIVHLTCDYLMVHHFADKVEEDCIIDPLGADVNFILQTVDICTVKPTIH